MKVDILTPRGGGGVLRWGRDLVDALNATGQASARHIHSLPRLAMTCLHTDADIVHSAVPIPLKLWNNPLIATVQGDYTVESRLWREPYQKLVENADVVTVPCQYIQQKLGLKRAVVIPNAVFPDRFTPSKHDGPAKLVTVANFHFHDKAIGILDIARILARMSNFQYTVIGGGKYLEEIQRSCAGMTNINFAGYLPDPRPALTDSGIFLYYSHHDTFPIAILEAMASGLPVVTNDIGAASEIIDNGIDGYVVRNDKDYFARIQMLLGNRKLRQEIGQNARVKVENYFDWSGVVEQFMKVYLQMQGKSN